MTLPEAPPRRRIIQDSTHFLSATIVGQGVGLIRALMIPVLFNPAQLGVWNLMNVVLGYGTHAHVGLLHGMNRAIPALRGQGRSAEVESMKDSVFWVVFGLASAGGAGLWIASVMAPPAYVIPLRLTAVAVFWQMLFIYWYSLLRADSRFKLVSAGVVGLSILTTVFVVGLAIAFPDHLLGGLSGVAAAYAATVVFWFVRGRYRFGLTVRRSSLVEAFKLGMPLVLLGLFDSAFLSVDRWLIAAHVGEAQLGHYALGIMVGGLLGLVPGSVSSVLYPRMLERVAVDDDPMAARSLLLAPTRALAAIMIIVTGASAIGVPLVIRLFLPKYLLSIPIVEVLSLAAFFQGISFVPGSFMVSVNKQHWLFAAQAVGIVFVFSADTVLLRFGYGIRGVAVGTLLGYAVYGIGYTLFAVRWAVHTLSEALRFVVRIVAPFIAVVASVVATHYFVPPGLTPAAEIEAAAAKLGIVLVMSIGALWMANRDGEVMAIVRGELMTRFRRGRSPQ